MCGFGFTVDGRFLIMQHLFKKYLVYQYVRFVAEGGLEPPTSGL